MINREEAFILIKKYLKDEDNIKYSLAVEAILRELANILERNEEIWGLVGLLHNLDYEYTSSDPEKRGTLSAQLLDDLLPERAVNAIRSNNYTHTDYIPTTSLDKSLIAVDATARLIFATIHTIDSKKITDVNLEKLMNKFLDSSFASRINRNKIQLCNDVGIDLETFLKLSLDILKKKSEELNL